MSSRPAPHPAGKPPPYAFVTRVYRSNLRPVVLALAFITAIWTLVWSIGFYKDSHTDKDQSQPKLAVFAIVLGTLYVTTTAIEVFGIAAASLQRFSLIRIYAFLTIIAAVIVIAAGFMRVITHFILKNDLIDECFKIATSQGVDFRWGIWGPHLTETLQPDKANVWCNHAWNNDSWSEIVGLIAAIILMTLFSFVTWSYVHQSLSIPERTQTVPVPAYNNPYYNPPYAGTDNALPHLGYGAGGGYASAGATDAYGPPPGPPPSFALPKDNYEHELPGYGAGMGGDAKGDMKDREQDIAGKGDDPFADFDERRDHRL